MTEEELKQQLTAAEEQLAEMREALTMLTSAVSGNIFTFESEVAAIISNTNMAVLRHWWKNAEQTLSAAPKRGRVVWEGTGYGKAYEYHNPRGKILKGTAIILDDDAGWFVVPSDEEGKRIEVIAREAEVTGPIDCPMCGVAGGDELGPCSMCKGAGFVEAEDVDNA